MDNRAPRTLVKTPDLDKRDILSKQSLREHRKASEKRDDYDPFVTASSKKDSMPMDDRPL